MKVIDAREARKRSFEVRPSSEELIEDFLDYVMEEILSTTKAGRLECRIKAPRKGFPSRKYEFWGVDQDNQFAEILESLGYKIKYYNAMGEIIYIINW